MSDKQTDLDQLCVNAVRFLSVDGVEAARSGHPGAPMAQAPMAYALWTRFLRHNPADPAWPDRDRFVLSSGHASMLLYSLLHLTGYDLPLEELGRFRQLGARTPGHPEFGVTPGVETTTGPLGQGFANGVGMAMAERFLAEKFNRPGHEIVNHFTYAICSDGDLMEGVSHEAASLAGHLRLGKLIYLYDDNSITIEGKTDLAWSEDRLARLAAYGWHTQQVDDGNDLGAVTAALEKARAVTDKPSIIAVRTVIGFGAPNVAGSASCHGAPLGPEETRAAKENLGWPVEPAFHVPEEARAELLKARERGAAAQAEWEKRFSAYEKAEPELAAEFRRWISGELPPGWDADLPGFPADEKGVASRAASGTVLNAVAAKVPNLIGGSADLAPSNKTLIKDEADFQAASPGGRNLRFGVREHAMGSVLNGMALHGGLVPYGATFLVFSDYMRPAVRLAAIMKLKVIYVFTHDSIGVGEDGPTHEPVEHVAALRLIPGLTVIRPADANETAEAWRAALTLKGPVALALTRQNLPTVDRAKFGPASDLARGAYILADCECGNPELIVIATGSEVSLALAAAKSLCHKEKTRVRVVSMPSRELFERQPQEYRDEVLPPAVTKRVAVEAGVSFGWDRYVGPQGATVTIDRFGESGPYKQVFEHFGFTVENVAAKCRAVLGS
ncbi:MAG: transketolase [Planctomycetota bacterium]|jgi:transketolase